MNSLKQRHGCVTFWIWLVILMNLGYAVFYGISMFDAYSSDMSLGFGLLAIMGILNVLGAILLMRWNKLGFYLFLINSLLAVFINIGLLSMQPVTVISSLFAILVWWGILQIRKNGISAWKQMASGWDYKHCRHLYQFFSCIIGMLVVLTCVAYSGAHKNDLSDDSDIFDVDSIARENILPVEDALEWKVFMDTSNACRVEAPSDFRKTKFNEDQILSLMCTDYDPAVSIIQEPVSSLEEIGVTSVKEYATLILKLMKNTEGVSEVKKIREEPYGSASYLIEFEVVINDNRFNYNVLATKTNEYYYYCQVFCLDAYSEKLQAQIARILSSFKALK